MKKIYEVCVKNDNKVEWLSFVTLWAFNFLLHQFLHFDYFIRKPGVS